MRMQLLSKTLGILLLFVTLSTYAVSNIQEANASIDRIQLVNEQINLLQNRLKQSEQEIIDIAHRQEMPISETLLAKASKNLLEKATLDISVAKSNVDGITIEYADAQQTVSWLEKGVQEIDNQLNVLSMFGAKIAANQAVDIAELRKDLHYQKKLLVLEKSRVKLLQQLQKTANNLLQMKYDNYNRLVSLLKFDKMSHMKQQQIKDELAFQEQQNHWLEALNILYTKLSKIDPSKEKEKYAEIERNIFYSNENANFAYTQSLIARYKDQIQQMKLAITKNNSISLLNEMSDQIQALTKQINRLDNVLKSRIAVMDKHITYLTPRKEQVPTIKVYVSELAQLKSDYKASDEDLKKITDNLTVMRLTLEQAIQNELSSRQGFPTFNMHMLLDLGKESLLVPALTFQVLKSLSTQLIHAGKIASPVLWSIYLLFEMIFTITFFFVKKILTKMLTRPSQWRDRINSKWLSLQWLRRNLLEFGLLSNMVGTFFLFGIPFQHYSFILSLASVWLIFKAILTIARLCLVETIHHGTGDDVQLYGRLKWIILVAGSIVALTVFVHQLPLIYELKTLCEQLFLFFLMIFSLFALRSWNLVPNLILPQLEVRHPYLQRSIQLFCVLIPVLLLGNSVIGLLGFMNLVMTIAWYEGLFLLVLIGYLMLRGILSDGMEWVSRLMIQYVNNGWLWTEAFLKPLDRILRIVLFFTAGGLLFLLYGWDQQSPIVERLTRALHYQLASVLNMVITPISIIEVFAVISVFYWTAKWTREFVYRMLLSRTKDIGIRNSIAILSQYCVVMIGAFICLRVLGINLTALTAVASMFAFGIGLGLRDLANNFACGFLILLERPLRIGDIVNINGIEGEVVSFGGRAISIRTWDHMELSVPNAEIFNKTFINWTAQDNNVRTVLDIVISRYDNPHEVKNIIQTVLSANKDVLKEPITEVLLSEMNDILMHFEIRYFVNIRRVRSRKWVASTVLTSIWDAFAEHGIKPAHPYQEIILRDNMPDISSKGELEMRSAS